MAKKTHTKDELYVLSLYKAAQEAGDPEGPIDRYAAGKHAGLSSKGIDAVCKLLVQTNFIKKEGESGVFLTPHGIKLAERLLSESLNQRIR